MTTTTTRIRRQQPRWDVRFEMINGRRRKVRRQWSDKLQTYVGRKQVWSDALGTWVGF